MTARLTISRQLSFGVELRRGLFEIFLDGTSAATLANHETAELSLAPGGHSLQIRKGRYSSRKLAFEVTEGGVVNFRCHGIRIWPLYVASIFVPSLAIALRQE
jgi:hypothetical protein